MGLEVSIIADRVEFVDADAILLPVDGQICRLGGAVASGLRLALSPEERADEMDYIENELVRLRPLAHPRAQEIDGVARWSKIIVSAAYPHNVDGALVTPNDCARMVRSAVPMAIALAAQLQIPSLAATLIGTAYRMPPDLAIRAFVDGIAAASKHSIHLRWSLPQLTYRQIARTECERLGIRIRPE